MEVVEFFFFVMESFGITENERKKVTRQTERLIQL
jgi:hypothetical protein